MNNPLKRLIEFIQTPSHTRTISAVVILIIAAAVPLTVIMSQKQQEIRQNAATPTPYVCSAANCSGPSACVESGPTSCELYTTGCRNNQCTYGAHAACTGCTHTATPTPVPTGQINPTTAPTPVPTAGTCKAGTGGASLSNCGGHASYTCVACGQCEEYTYRCINNNTQCAAGPHTPVAASNCTSSCKTTALCSSPSPTPAGQTPSPTPAGQTPSPTPSLAAATNLIQQTYCGVGAPPPGSTSGNQINVSTTYFLWTRPLDGSPVYVTYINKTTGVQWGPYLYGSGTANSFYAPRPAGDTTVKNPTNGATYTFTQCSGNQSGTGYSCGFSYGNTIEWWVTTTAGVQSQHVTYTAASCPPASPTPTPTSAPSCGNISANPSSVPVNGTSNVSISCNNVNYYNWTTTCGSYANPNSASTVWTAPNYGPTSCSVSVQACADSSCGAGSVTSTTSINVTVPDCNGSSQGVGIADCSQAVCQPTQVNACGVSSGTETCVYNTYNVNSNVCNPQNISNQSCNASCANGVACYNNVCQNATPTPAPSGSPSPTPTPAPGSTILALKIGIDAIGSVGDNENPNPSSSNQNPLHPTRNVTVQVFDSNNNQVSNQIGSINYNAGTGIFTGAVNLGTSFTSGNYTVKVKSDGHLRRIIPGIQNITHGQTVQMPQVNLVAGDVNGDNALNITDYNILLSCVNDPDIANVDNHQLCNSNQNYATLSDLDDNGAVNKYDYNLFVREYSVQSGD